MYSTIGYVKNGPVIISLFVYVNRSSFDEDICEKDSFPVTLSF